MFWLHPKKTFHNLLPPTLPSDRLVPAGRDVMVLGEGFQHGRRGKDEGRGQKRNQEKITIWKMEILD